MPTHPPLESDQLGTLARVLLKLRHLEEVCPRCRSRLRAVRPGRARIWSLRQLPKFFREALGTDSAAEAAALREVYHLARLPAEERLRAIRGARSKFRSSLVAAFLVEHGRAAVHQDPADSEGWALAAQAVAYRAHDSALEAWALAVVGNARRARGELSSAAEAFSRSRHLLALIPEVPPLTAEVDALEGSLRSDLRDFSGARDLFERALSILRTGEDQTSRAKVLLKISIVHRREGDAGMALAAVKSAIELLHPLEQPRLFRTAHHNLAAYLLDAGAISEAAEVAAAIRPLFEVGDTAALRLRWLEAEIAAAAGRTAIARNELAALVEEFLALGAPVLAAVVALDLAELYVSKDDAAAGELLAGCLPAIFHSEGLEAETAAALLLFNRALSRRAVTAQLLQQLRETLALVLPPAALRP